jgi:hybrid cluster-associated redox disulfide protein
MMIADVLERWPRTADVFHRHAMACVGCAVAPFYSIIDAALVYRLSPEQFVAELLAVILAVME